MSAEAPELGDLAWLSFSPHVGREQAGRRPALILSPKDYNQRIGLALACPITSRIKGYPFEVVIMGIAGLQGAVQADHVRSVDWRARRVDYRSGSPCSGRRSAGEAPPVADGLNVRVVRCRKMRAPGRSR